MRGALLLLFFCPAFLFSALNSSNVPNGYDVPFEPWLTGPLLAPNATNADIGHPSLFLNFSFLDIYGEYDNNWNFKNDNDIWVLTYLFDVQYAITKRFGMEIIGAFTSRYSDGKAETDLNDTIVLFGYQLSNDTKGTWTPDCRLILQTLIPTGPYDQLTSELTRALAITGQGSFFIGPGVAFQKLFHLTCNYLMIHWGVNYSFPITTPHVTDFNTYGGGIGTDGTIRPGQFLNANISMEYTFNQHWAYAMDLYVTYQRKSSEFKGFNGFTLEGEIAEVGSPTSIQISLTPSVEYSNSPKIGWLFGAWVTLAGQNSSAFAGGFLCLSYVL